MGSPSACPGCVDIDPLLPSHYKLQPQQRNLLRLHSPPSTLHIPNDLIRFPRSPPPQRRLGSDLERDLRYRLVGCAQFSELDVRFIRNFSGLTLANGIHLVF